MPKLTILACDGVHPDGAPCTVRAEMTDYDLPPGWSSVAKPAPDDAERPPSVMRRMLDEIRAVYAKSEAPATDEREDLAALRERSRQAAVTRGFTVLRTFAAGNAPFLDTVAGLERLVSEAPGPGSRPADNTEELFAMFDRLVAEQDADYRPRPRFHRGFLCPAHPLPALQPPRPDATDDDCPQV